MPVLGSPTTSTSGGKRGVYVPSGWGSRFKPARLSSGTTRVEVSVMGDSTTYGAADASSGPAWYSWMKKIQTLALAAGWGDGGHGFLHPADIGNSYNFDGDTFPKASSWIGFSAISFAYNTSYCSTTVGDSITFQGKGTAVRVHTPTVAGGSQVSITVDGGAATVVNTLRPATQTVPYDGVPTYFGGLTEGTHTVVVANSALGVIANGRLKAGSEGGYVSGGSLGVGNTYFYVSTVTSPNGESLPSPVRSGTVSGNRTWSVQYLAADGHTGANLYRATSSTGPYQLVTTVSGTYSFGAVITVTDDGTATPNAAINPPSSSTLGTLAGSNRAEFMIEFLRETGVTLHRDATSGVSLPSFFDSNTDSSSAANTSAARLGLLGLSSATNTTNPTLGASSPGPRPAYRNTRLVMLQIGTNDINSATDANYGIFKENLAMACRSAQAAGADVVLISPPYMAAVAPLARQWGGRYSAAALEVAQAYGAAWVDFAEPLGPVSQWSANGYGGGKWGAPHLPQAAYDAEAQFLWDNVLSQYA